MRIRTRPGWIQSHFLSLFAAILVLRDLDVDEDPIGGGACDGRLDGDHTIGRRAWREGDNRRLRIVRVIALAAVVEVVQIL